MASHPRPLSPHLQIYRLPLTAILSITHRITGVGLGLGALVLVAWLAAAAAGPSSFADMSALVGSWPGRTILLGFVWALFFHLCNGIRHLFWDAGYGYEIVDARRTGIGVLVASIVLTLLAFGLGCIEAAGTP